MGLLILLAIGGIFGWLAAIIVSEHDREMIGTDIAAGALGAALLGLLVGSQSPMEAIAPITILFGILGAIKGVAIINIVSRTLIKR